MLLQLGNRNASAAHLFLKNPGILQFEVTKALAGEAMPARG